MLAAIIIKELRLALRARRLAPLLMVWAALSMVAAFGSISAQQRLHDERASAVASERANWEGQGARNPHAAAHFGRYAFKPVSALGALDPGLDPWLGASVFMEAHLQNPAAQRSSEALTPLARMGTLSLGWMLQVLFPLTILILGFDLLSGERSRGELKQQLVAGASGLQLMVGKAVALLAMIVIVTAPAWIAVIAVITSLRNMGTFSDAGLRFGVWLGGYAGYGLAWLLLTLAISAFTAHARLSLATLCGIWIAGVILMPRLVVEQAQSLHPIPSPSTFWTEIDAARAQGIDGHDASDKRADALKQATLRKYGVDRIEDLPISFAGVSLQASEGYGNRVFDRYYARLWSGYAAQARLQDAWAWIAPVLAVRRLATQAAGTDLEHHWRFTLAAEGHRRTLERYLNGDYAAHGAGLDNDYLASPAFFARTPAFTYAPPRIRPAGSAIFVLLGWILAGLLACATAARRLSGEAAI